MTHLRTAPATPPAPRLAAPPVPLAAMASVSTAPVPMALLLVLLGGCTLIDQRTFNPDAGKPPPVAAAAAPSPPPAGPPALLTVRFDRPAAIEGPVRQAVALARARKRDVAFDVVSLVPDAAAVGAGAAEAARVARLITAQGVPAARVTLQTRLDPAVSAREVRVFVR